MEIINVQIGQVIINDYNPNQLTPSDYRNIRYSIEKYGLVIPILVRKKNNKGKYVIIDGEQRFLISKELGYKELPVVVYQGEEDEERYKQLTIIMDEFRGKIDKDIVAKILNRERDDVKELLNRLKIRTAEDMPEREDEFKKDIPDWEDSRIFQVDEDYSKQRIPYTISATEGEIKTIKDYKNIIDEIDTTELARIWANVSKKDIDEDEKFFLMFQLALRRALLSNVMVFKKQPEKPVSIVYRDKIENVKKVVKFIKNELRK
jgi:hypothetical protein